MLPFLRDVECPACGHRHSFSLPAGQWPAGTSCDYACPQTGAKTAVTLGESPEHVQTHPQGTILLSPQVAVPSPS